MGEVSGNGIRVVQATVGTAEVTLRAHDNDCLSRAFRLIPGQAGTLYVGPPGVTTAAGFPIQDKDAIVLDKTPRAQLNGIGSQAGIDVRFLEEYQV